MPPVVVRIPFTADLLASEQVRGFDCGPQPWEVEITTWLHAPEGEGGAVDEMLDQVLPSDVSLYLSESRELVGVGAFAPSRVSYPKPNSSLVKAWCITMLGVDRRHQNKGYGQAILEDLLARIIARGFDPRVVLYVRVGNPAVGFYTRNGFRPHGKPRKEEEGHENQRMLLDLSNATSVPPSAG